jgi:hypothetical protein
LGYSSDPPRLIKIAFYCFALLLSNEVIALHTTVKIRWRSSGRDSQEPFLLHLQNVHFLGLPLSNKTQKLIFTFYQQLQEKTV